MRKKVLTLQQARPALNNLIKDMKRKYASRNISFQDIRMVGDDELGRMLPTKVKNYLSETDCVRKVGNQSGINFYYFRLRSITGQETTILPIILFNITRNGNTGNNGNRILACSLDTYLPKITNEEAEINNLLYYFI